MFMGIQWKEHKIEKLFAFQRKSNNYFLLIKTNFYLKVDEIHTKTLHPYGASLKHKSKSHHERNDFSEHHNENGKSSRGKLNSKIFSLIFLSPVTWKMFSLVIDAQPFVKRFSSSTKIFQMTRAMMPK